ncbi:MAG: hypothetical protein ACK4NS_03050 [Saprospiraceae bacterium]
MSTIDWKYDILFAIRIVHTLDPELFVLHASADTGLTLRNHGLLVKSYPSGIVVVAEKKVMPGGGKTVLRKITQAQAFTFLIKARSRALLGRLKPFDVATPSLLSQPQTLYFDNLNAANQIDQNLSADNGKQVMTLQVGPQNWASLIPERFSYAPPTGVSTIQVTPRSPGASSTLSLDATNPQKLPLLLDLSPGAYRFNQAGVPSGSQLAIADDALYAENATGIVRIFKNEQVSYDTIIRYDLVFEAI